MSLTSFGSPASHAAPGTPSRSTVVRTNSSGVAIIPARYGC
ncbi:MULTISPECIES: hypothetical protein [unclassified Streptomyces]